MTETRRDLFKTSVASAFGLMSAAALTGCKEDIRGQGLRKGKGQKSGVSLDEPGTVILGYNQYALNGAAATWYVFHRIAAGWEVYTYDEAKYGAVTEPTTSSVDNLRWYKLKKSILKPVRQQFTFLNSSNTAVFDFQGDYLDQKSSDYLVGLEETAPYFSQATWNEIGKK
jgi:hypothetical protein